VKSARLWIIALACMSFLAGTAAGVLGVRTGAGDLDRGRFAAYGDWVIDEFDLSRERAGHLRVILREFDSKISKVERSHRAEYYAGLESELRPIGIEYNRYVRDKVLPPEQRAEFDALARGPRFSSTTPPN
jgi:hypothetical protein